jgi:hypothetical protein
MITPIVVGPNLVPVIDDADVAASSRELAMLSAMAHYAVPEVLEALAAAIATDFEHGHVYSELIWAVLSGAARAKWERLVTATTWEYQSPFARKYYGEGKAEGEAAGILTVLHARGIDVPDAVRERVQSCDDIEQLETWLRRAATAQTIGDVFD